MSLIYLERTSCNRVSRAPDAHGHRPARWVAAPVRQPAIAPVAMFHVEPISATPAFGRIPPDCFIATLIEPERHDQHTNRNYCRCISHLVDPTTSLPCWRNLHHCSGHRRSRRYRLLVWAKPRDFRRRGQRQYSWNVLSACKSRWRRRSRCKLRVHDVTAGPRPGYRSSHARAFSGPSQGTRLPCHAVQFRRQYQRTCDQDVGSVRFCEGRLPTARLQASGTRLCRCFRDVQTALMMWLCCLFHVEHSAAYQAPFHVEHSGAPTRLAPPPRRISRTAGPAYRRHRNRYSSWSPPTAPTAS
jgi:hypothetical protein